MKTTIDLPDDLLKRSKILAVQRQTSLKNLIVEGLNAVLKQEASPEALPSDALSRLKQGYQLGGSPISRNDLHER